MRRRWFEAWLGLAAVSVPRSWRATVRADVAEEARLGGRGVAWQMIQLVRTGAALRRESSADFLVTDLRHAIRSLRRSPGFTLAAVLTFALGVGVNLALFSIVDRLMFRPLPYHQPERLVHLHTVTRAGTDRYALMPHRIAEFVRERSTTIEEMAYADLESRETTLEGFGDSGFRFAIASDNLLGVLGVQPTFGRTFAPVPGPGPARQNELLLTAEAWRGRFGGRTDIVGMVLRSGAQRYQVVGVLPDGFILPTSHLVERIDGVMAVANVIDSTVTVIQLLSGPVARLRPGASLDAARAEMAVLAERVRVERPEAAQLMRADGIVVQPLQRGLFFLYEGYLWPLVVAASLAWLIASVNLSTLLLARGRSRERLVVVQSALGATRVRIALAQALEAVLVCGAGGAMATAAVLATDQLTLRFAPPIFRSFAASAFDLRFLAGTAVLCLISAVSGAAVPAWRAARVDLVESLNRAGRGSTAPVVGGGWLLAFESAVSVVIVAAAASTAVSYLGLIFRPSGMEATDLYTFDARHGTRPDEPSDDREQRARRVLDVVQATPGIVAVASVSRLPIGDRALARDFWRDRGIDGGLWGVTEDIFRVLGTRVIGGRSFSRDEAVLRQPVAIVNVAGARALWPGEAPTQVLGRTIDVSGTPHLLVGVVEDVRRYPGDAALPSLYVPPGAPGTRRPQSSVSVLLRMAPGVTPPLDVIAAGLDDHFGQASAIRIDAVADLLAPWYDGPRFQAILLAVLAIVALILAAVGLYAMASFEAARRRSEMGVRLALGATATHLRRAIVGGAVKPVALGVSAGLVLVWWTSSFVQALVFEVDARSPWTFAAVAATLGVTAIGASWLPARRAARTDPVDVLRA